MVKISTDAVSTIAVGLAGLHAARAAPAKSAGGQPRQAVVTGARTGGKVNVTVDGYATTATITAATRSVRDGDTVQVVKTGGAWQVTEAITWHEPPVAAAPEVPSGSAPNVAVPALVSVSWPGVKYNYTGGLPTDWANARSWVESLMGAVTRLEDSSRDNTDRLQTSVNTLRGSASGLNQLGQYVNATAQAAVAAVKPLTEALDRDGVVAKQLTFTPYPLYVEPLAEANSSDNDDHFAERVTQVAAGVSSATTAINRLLNRQTITAQSWASPGNTVYVVDDAGGYANDLQIRDALTQQYRALTSIVAALNQLRQGRVPVEQTWPLSWPNIGATSNPRARNNDMELRKAIQQTGMQLQTLRDAINQLRRAP